VLTPPSRVENIARAPGRATSKAGGSPVENELAPP
jgi:hypothetical protein